MIYTYEYKLQGDGRDSWVRKWINEYGIEENRDMIYEDPTKPVIPVVDLVELLKAQSPETIAKIKEILK